MSVTVQRFGRKVRFVLFSAWLRKLPDIGRLPVSSQHLLMD
jgi:hypothetical protein